MATPSVLFVCVRNGGKSQMAPALMNAAAAGSVVAYSAGTDPGAQLNGLSVQALAEVGVDMSNGRPKPIDPDLLRAVDRVITLGREAEVEAPDGVNVRTWDTDEPSERGIDGIERMRLVRDDIDRHVRALLDELTDQGRTPVADRPPSVERFRDATPVNSAPRFHPRRDGGQSDEDRHRCGSHRNARHGWAETRRQPARFGRYPGSAAAIRPAKRLAVIAETDSPVSRVTCRDH